MHDHRNADHAAFPVLVLAAGASRRMGRPKAMLPLAGGTLLDRAITQAKQLGNQVSVVTGGHYPLMRYRVQQQPTRWVFAEHWAQGMSASLQAGLEQLGPQAKGVFVLLLDQPQIQLADLVHFSAYARENPGQPFAAEYHGRPGAPAYIPRHLWPELMMLSGDRGAAAILERHGALTFSISGAHQDVDTPEDWRSFVATRPYLDV